MDATIRATRLRRFDPEEGALSTLCHAQALMTSGHLHQQMLNAQKFSTEGLTKNRSREDFSPLGSVHE